MAIFRGVALTRASIARRLFVQPEKFGAIGNGIADDGPAVRLCLLACMSEGVAMELTRGKTYLCATWTTIDTILSTYINGNEALLRGPATRTDFFTFGGPLLIWRNVRFARWRCLENRAIGQTGDIGEFKFLENDVTDCSSIAINCERPIESYRICDNKFHDSTGAYVIRIGTNNGAASDTWKDGWINDNAFQRCSGTSSTAAALVYGWKVKICRNLVEDLSCTGSEEAWGFYTKCRYGTYNDNTIRNVTAAVHDDIVGINIKGLDRGPPDLPQGFACVATGNTIINVGRLTGTLTGAGIRGQTDDVIIANNIIDDCGLIGVTIDESAGTINSRVSNNRIWFTTPFAGRTGVYYAAGGSGHVCSDNILRGTDAGIRLQTGASAAGSDYYVHHNVIEAASAAIVTNSPQAMDNVRIHSNSLTAGARGFINDSGGGALTKWDFKDNDFSVATTAKFAGTAPTSVRYQNNRGWMESATTYDPGNLNDGVGVTQSVTCLGTLPGDIVHVGFSNMQHGILLHGYVVSANTASVRFQNESGGAIDLGSGTLTVRCERL